LDLPDTAQLVDNYCPLFLIIDSICPLLKIIGSNCQLNGHLEVSFKIQKDFLPYPRITKNYITKMLELVGAI
jgi:hypothetical protein